MKYLFLLMAAIMLMTLRSLASIQRLCKVQYQTEEGWSKEYTLSVEFATGKELNKRTNSYDYGFYDNYCLIWFEQGQVAILEIIDYISSVGDEFDHEDFVSAFSFRSEIDCKQTNSGSKRKWRIKAKEYATFIDPKENN
jgi:hypothetical protein